MLELRKSADFEFEFFWGREGGSLVGGDRGQGWTGGVGAGQARTERFRGLTVAKSSVLNPTKKNDVEFFWGREVPGRRRQRRELGGGS